MKFSESIRRAIFDAMLLDPRLRVLGQGVWSPFYVGKTMDGLVERFGKTRVIDTPVSENAITGIALGSAIAGSPTLVIHPRIDFSLLAIDPIVNAAAKWRYSLSWKDPIPLTIRLIINRGGEQGAQHSQSLQSWFSHVPGLFVLMPGGPRDAYLMMRSCLQSPDPCIFIDDRWNYDLEEDFEIPSSIPSVSQIVPKVVVEGDDLSLVGFGNSLKVSLEVSNILRSKSVYAEVIDVRNLSSTHFDAIYNSVSKTRRLVVIDASWSSCSFSAEILARVVERGGSAFLNPPLRFNLPNAPAPTSVALERLYYQTSESIADEIYTRLGFA